MSSPENPPIDERFDELVSELRAARPTAPDALRQRVSAIAARPPVPPRKLRITWVLAPAAAALAVGAVAVGVLFGGDAQQPQEAAAPLVERAAKDSTTSGLEALSAQPMAPAKRAQRYLAEITLRVQDLSDVTQDALRQTRALGGYVRTVDYGEGRGEGTARLVLRVPIGRVQTAILRFSELGTILDQHVSVRDVQRGLDRRFTRIAELRRAVRALSGDDLAAAKAELEALQAAQARERRQASFATVSLDLTTAEKEVVPAPPGRIERAFERAADVLAAEAVAVVYAAVVAAPFILLGLVVVIPVRAARSRSDKRLLGY
jgi:Domain of unknown function (DUF4349)